MSSPASLSGALRLAPFRRLLLARTISNLGNGMHPLALSFGVLGMPDGSATALSLLLASQALAVMLALPLGGVIADRVGSARVIGATEIMLSGVVAVTGMLFISGAITLPVLFGLGLLAGALVGFWAPAFVGLTPDTVGPALVQPANSGLSLAENLGFIVGALVGGLIVATAGAGWAMLLDAVSFLVAGGLALTLRAYSQSHHSGESVMGDLTSGWRTFRALRWAVAFVAVSSVLAMVGRGAQEVLGPVLALDIYDGPIGWSVVLGAQSAGLLLGALVAVRLVPRRPLVFATALGSVLVVFLTALAAGLPLPAVALASLAWGVATQVMTVLWLSALQTRVPRAHLARVSAYDRLSTMLLGSIGLALAGPLSAGIGVTSTVAIGAVLTAMAVVVTLALPAIRS